MTTTGSVRLGSSSPTTRRSPTQSHRSATEALTADSLADLSFGERIRRDFRGSVELQEPARIGGASVSGPRIVHFSRFETARPPSAAVQGNDAESLDPLGVSLRKVGIVGTLIGSSLVAGTDEAGATQGRATPITASLDGGSKAMDLISERQRYEKVREWFRYVESLPAGSADRVMYEPSLRNEWKQLRDQAVNGDLGSLKVLHATVLDQMYREIREPDAALQRYDYESWNQLHAQFQDPKVRATEIQWRALLGARCFYYSRLDASNDHCAPADRFFDPTLKLLKEHPAHPEIQRWGSALLVELAPRLDTARQEQLVKHFVDVFLAADNGSDRRAALRLIPRLYSQYPRLAVWNDLRSACASGLAEPEAVDAHKFYVVALAFVGDPGIAARVKSAVSGASSSDLQCAGAWALGRLRSFDGLSHLEKIVGDDAYSVLARETALSAITEHAALDTLRVRKFLHAQSLAANQPNEDLRMAAIAQLEKLSGEVRRTPNYFLDKMLSEEEKAPYLALRARYIPNIDKLKLTTEQLNLIDRALIPYRPNLERLVELGDTHAIAHTGAVTQAAAHRNMIGMRSFDGRLWDTIHGLGLNNGQAVTSSAVIADGFSSTFAHEFMHHIHLRTFTPEQAQKVTDLYKRAVRAGECLNYYAASNDREYLAVGNEAYDAAYLDHYYLFERAFNQAYDASGSQTRTQLKFRDGPLYRFLRELRGEIPN